jgi:hypothetical protein
LNIQVEPFIHDMAKAYSDADLIICRAGALTVTEVATAGLAACLFRYLSQWMITRLQMHGSNLRQNNKRTTPAVLDDC